VELHRSVGPLQQAFVCFRVCGKLSSGLVIVVSIISAAPKFESGKGNGSESQLFASEKLYIPFIRRHYVVFDAIHFTAKRDVKTMRDPDFVRALEQPAW